MKIIKSEKYKKAQEVSINGFDVEVDVWFVGDNGKEQGIRDEVWTLNGDEEEAKRKFVNDLIQRGEIKQEQITRIEVLNIGPHTKLKDIRKQRADLGWRVMQFEDINEVGPNQDIQEMDSMTPNIMNVGRSLWGSQGEALLETDEYIEAIEELTEIVKNNKEFITPLSNEDIKEIQILISLLNTDMETYGQE